MKIRKKISLLLVLTLLLTLLPAAMPVMAATMPTNIQLVKDDSNFGGITTGQIIYFGKDKNNAAIGWRVMGVEGNRTTLLSDKILDYRAYDTSGQYDWPNSDICHYLNSAGTYENSPTEKGFLKTAFTNAEQGIITKYSETEEPEHNNCHKITPYQKVVLPSIDETWLNEGWGFNDQQSRGAKSIAGLSSTYYYNNWWLRSTYTTYGGISIGPDGGLETIGRPLEQELGVRPALKLDLSAVLFASDAAGSGAKRKWANCVLFQTESPSNERKLTLINPYNESTNPTGQKAVTAAAKGAYIPGETAEIEINYSGAVTGTNQYLSAMITDNGGNLRYYGVIKDLSAAEATNGMAKVTIPTDFDSHMTLKIFTEQLNGDKCSDYASEPVTLAVGETDNKIALQLKDGSTVYFGKKDHSPILWRVMKKDTANETLTLMSEYILEYRQYDSSQEVRWVGADICKYLNSQDKYEGKGFLDTAFSSKEQEFIAAEYSNTWSNGKNYAFPFTPNQKIVLPSQDDISNIFSLDKINSIAQNAIGISGENGHDTFWWVRFLGPGSPHVEYVDHEGIMNFSNQFTLADELGVRPALKLNLFSATLTAIQSIKMPDDAENIENGISKEILVSKLPETVKSTTLDEEKFLKVVWDVENCTYNPAKKEQQTFSVSGKVQLPEGVVKLQSGVNLDTSINVTVKAASYPITYTLNGGTQLNLPTAYSYGIGAALPVPTREGYEFKGWYDNKAMTGSAITSISAADSGAKAYWAKWERISVGPSITTTSLPNGTVGTAYTQALSAAGDIPITWSLVSGALPAGLSLNGATGVISGTPQAADASNFTVKAVSAAGSDTRSLSIIITAVPVPPQTYTVTFDSNGGYAISSVTNITSGTAITLPIPIRANYQFDGWFKGNVKYTSSTPITENTTLAAKWTAVTTPNSSSGGGTSTAKPLTIEKMIEALTKVQKEAAGTYFKEKLPYTTMNPSLTAEALKRLTGNQFTDAQLKEILATPALLESLGIPKSVESTLVTLHPVQDAAFKDVSQSHWANEMIRKAASLGFVSGMPDGSFAPSEALQTADTFTFLDRVLLLNNITGTRLPRSTVEKYITNKNHWAFASKASIASKLSEETLKAIVERGDRPISRELLAQVLYEITEGRLKSIKAETAFEDIQNSYYKEAINYCTRTGLLNGTDSKHMAPSKAVTRAELMAVLIRLNDKLK